MTIRRSREPLPDALRALSLLGVLMVNVLGYRQAPWGRLFGTPQPVDSLWAEASTFLVAALVQGKAYPVLAMLFGMGMAYAAKGRPRPVAIAAADKRNRRLLALGVAHGLFVYFGDILTLYALCGFWVTRQLHEPWRDFGRRLRRALAWAAAAVAASTAIVFLPSPPADTATLGTTRTYLDFLSLNGGTYLVAQVFALLFALPLVRLAMLAGVAAVRLRLLTHRRWRDRVQSFARRWGPVLLLANTAYGVAYLAAQDRGALLLQTLSVSWTMPLAAVYVALASTSWHAGRRRWIAWLAPLGQRTLTVYVGSSLLLLCLFSGVGLAWPAGTVAHVVYAAALWCGVVLAGRFARRRWPLEAWMARA